VEAQEYGHVAVRAELSFAAERRIVRRRVPRREALRN
jgi:hypothetical protein